MQDKIQPQDGASASVILGGGAREEVMVHGWYDVECYGPDGRLKWKDRAYNLVTTVGKNDLLDKYLKGSAYTQTIRMGLAGTGTKAAGDTQASHAGWLEVGGTNAPAYTGDRKDVVMGSAAAGVSTSPAQAFAITSAGTIAGCFINNGGSATKDNTTGVLFSAGNFTGGDRVVANLDTVNVTYSLAV